MLNQQNELAQREELLSPSQVMAWFRANGVSILGWAISNGYSPALVYAVVKGNRKCLRGESHQIAVALKMKRGTPQR